MHCISRQETLRETSTDQSLQVHCLIHKARRLLSSSAVNKENLPKSPMTMTESSCTHRLTLQIALWQYGRPPWPGPSHLVRQRCGQNQSRRVRRKGPPPLPCWVVHTEDTCDTPQREQDSSAHVSDKPHETTECCSHTRSSVGLDPAAGCRSSSRQQQTMTGPCAQDKKANMNKAT